MRREAEAASTNGRIEDLRKQNAGRAQEREQLQPQLQTAENAYATALGAEDADVALTTCTTEGMAQVIGLTVGYKFDLPMMAKADAPPASSATPAPAAPATATP